MMLLLLERHRAIKQARVTSDTYSNFSLAKSHPPIMTSSVIVGSTGLVVSLLTITSLLVPSTPRCTSDNC